MDSTRGAGPFTQRTWSDWQERQFGLVASGDLIVIQRRPVFRSAWTVHSSKRWAVPLLRLVYISIPILYWRVVESMWEVGLIEFEESALFSWRRHFRPFPWRGVRRG